VKWLIDEMLPPSTTGELGTLGHDAVSVVDVDLQGADDALILELAVVQERALMTENFADFANLLEQRQRQDEPCTPVLFVRKSAFPSGGALASRLAKHLHDWAEQNPEPFGGLPWP
jgi:hypothetical protein